MKKKLALVLAGVMMLSMFLLSGCSKAQPLPDGMVEEEVSAAAQNAVDLLRKGEYQTVADLFRDDMQKKYGVDAALVQQVADAVTKAGDYVKTDKILVLGGKSSDFNEPYAAVAVYCEHEKKDVVYELSFDLNLELIGLASDVR